jgi:hypothetical protein
MTGQPTAATARWRVAYAPSKGIEVRGAPMPLLGLPRFHVMPEHHAGWPVQEWLLELDETRALRVAIPVSREQDDTRLVQNGLIA